MGRKLQLPDEPIVIANAIKDACREKRYTLEKIQSETGVNKGQISRFCNGDFKRMSTNLQQVLQMLQISEDSIRPAASSLPRQLVLQLERIWQRAGRKRPAVSEAIDALDQLVE
jgi:transcriptional regulator with XRE-family HTH domain